MLIPSLSFSLSKLNQNSSLIDIIINKQQPQKNICPIFYLGGGRSVVVWVKTLFYFLSFIISLNQPNYLTIQKKIFFSFFFFYTNIFGLPPLKTYFNLIFLSFERWFENKISLIESLSFSYSRLISRFLTFDFL